MFVGNSTSWCVIDNEPRTDTAGTRRVTWRRLSYAENAP